MATKAKLKGVVSATPRAKYNPPPHQCGITRSRTQDYDRRRRTGPSSPKDKDDATEALIAEEESAGVGGRQFSAASLTWQTDLDDIKQVQTEVKQKMAQLAVLHKEHIEQPGFDGGMEQEHKIEIMTSQITQLFHKCQKSIAAIGRKSAASPSAQLKRLGKNVVSSQARDLQELSMGFRKTQSSYLKRLRGQEERNFGYGLSGMDQPGQAAAMEDIPDDEDAVDLGFTDEQTAQVQDSTNMVRQRESEVTKIVESIHELTDIFKDLALLVVDQGTILDRIDYNIETAATAIEQGHKNLEQGEKYQKSATKKRIILLLIVIIVGILFALIFKKKVVGGAADTTTTPRPVTQS
eukprot:m.92458 g.92458  ORF g.92458 m.92458 type:complete len:351 (+) comp13352_c0_seq1:146-1198(+)